MASDWDRVYVAKTEAERSWTQENPSESLHYIEQAHLETDAAIIDVGGGSSRLADELIRVGYTDVTVLDVSATAIHEAQARFSAKTEQAPEPQWIVGDILSWKPPRRYALWHDRAVFHFLTSSADQQSYIGKVLTGTAPGSQLVIATYAPTGPDMCSGMPIARWSQESLATRFREYFDVAESCEQMHATPWGEERPFTWLRMVRR